MRKLALACTFALACAAFLAVAPPRAARATMPGKNGRIAYDYWDGSDYEIGTELPDGSGFVQVTTNSATEYNPAWSPDGKKLCFESTLTGNLDVWTVNADGTGMKQLTSNPDNDGTCGWSADGKTIAFTSHRNGRFQLFSMTAGGAHEKLLIDAPGASQPSYSPDGTHLAYAAGKNHIDVWVANVDGTRRVNLTKPDTLNDEQAPDWSPSGKKIVYSKAGDIWLMSARGKNRHALTSSGANDRHPVWSPDGKMFAYSSDSNGNPDIWLSNLTFTTGSNITYSHSTVDEMPAWGVK